MSRAGSDLHTRVDRLESRIEDLAVAVENLRLAVAQGQTEWTVVTEDPRAETSSSAGSSSGYNDLAKEIPAVPALVSQSCYLLSGGSLSPAQRAARAWESGWWARFCLANRIAKPRPSLPIDLQNQFYVVLRAEGCDCPLLFAKASDYRAAVGDFKEGTLSHGFPSETEAKIYCQGAGVNFPAVVSTWRSLQQA